MRDPGHAVPGRPAGVFVVPAAVITLLAAGAGADPLPPARAGLKPCMSSCGGFVGSIDRGPIERGAGSSDRGVPLLICGSGASAGERGLTLRLRDVHVAEVFESLHQLTGESFLVSLDP